MKNRLSWMLAVGPIIAIAYFTRVGEGSFYLFDPYSAVLVLFALQFVPLKRAIVVLLGCGVFVATSAVGLLGTAAGYGAVRLDQFAVASLRYTQLIFLTYVVVMVGRQSRVAMKPYAPKLLLVAAAFPLVTGILLLQFNPASVLVFDRFSSYLSSPNNVGAFICVSIPAVNFVLATMKSRPWRWAGAIVFYLFAGFSLFYAGSNSGWMLCMVSFATSLLALKGRSTRRIAVAAVVIGVAVIASYLLQDWLLDSEIKGLRNTGELIVALRYGEELTGLGSGQLRLALVADAWRLYFSSAVVMFFGVGLGQSPELIGAGYSSHITAHNAYLVLLVETGLIGVLVLATLFFGVIKFAGANRTTFSLTVGYLLAMLGTPHIYLPFLWACMSFALYIFAASSRAVPVADNHLGAIR